ncbi:MAG TPA: ribosome biogenesis protein [Nitrososphaera sp.]
MLAEAALETVPAEIAGHPAVSSRAHKLGSKAIEILLDRSYHHAAMKNLEENWKRGRPDIVHFALVEALATPLFISGNLDVFVHTYGNKVISVAEGLRIPKSYFRFEGVMASLFRDGVVKSDDGKVLLEIQDGTLEELIHDIEPDRVVGLSSAGVQSSAQEVVAKNKVDYCAFVVGAFPKGHFSEKTTQLFNCTYSIHETGLETHVVVARILYECEKARPAA